MTNHPLTEIYEQLLNCIPSLGKVLYLATYVYPPYTGRQRRKEGITSRIHLQTNLGMDFF